MLTKQEISLIKELTVSEFKLRYKNSVLGFFWSLLKPLAMLTTLYIVFRIFIKIDSEQYSLFLLLGIILWNFFSESTVFGLNSIVSKSGIVKKMNFKYGILIISACLVSFLSFLLNFMVFAIFLLFIKGLPSLISLFIIFPVMALFLLSLGASFALATFFIKYRDIGYLWDIILQIGFWISPIAYPIEIIPAKYLNIYMLNPLANLITISRGIVLDNKFPNPKMMLTSFITLLIILMLGYAIYKLKHRKFIEYI